MLSFGDFRVFFVFVFVLAALLLEILQWFPIAFRITFSAEQRL